MTLVPIRGLGEIGVISDLSPQDLPLTAWNDAINLRFADGKVSRYSSFKNVADSYSYSKTPVGVIDGGGAGDEGNMVTIFSDGTYEQFLNGGLTNVTPTPAPAAINGQITGTYLGGVTYVNSGTDVPTYRTNPAAGAFTPLPGWTAGNTCGSLRAYKDFLIALDCTLSGTNYPGMVKWSNAVQAGSPPADWDTANPASLAGENVLNDIRGKLIDAKPLGSMMILYGEHQSFIMDYLGAPLVFRFTKLFEDQGAIAKNCIVDVNNTHYVFGRSDIYIHDGVSKVSIADKKVLKRVFSELDFTQRSRCFVYHDRFQSEIAFCYPSKAEEAPWPIAEVDGCNRAAVFNYVYQTWTFVDLPNAKGFLEAAITFNPQWGDLPVWNEAVQTWRSAGGAAPRLPVLIGGGNSTQSKEARPYFIDVLHRGLLGNTVDTDVLWPAFGLLDHKDMDDLGADIYGLKQINRVVPQAITGDPDGYVTFSLGTAVSLMADNVWNEVTDFYPWVSQKFDSRVNGRYLSMKWAVPAGTYGELSGFDLDLIKIAGR